MTTAEMLLRLVIGFERRYRARMAGLQGPNTAATLWVNRDDAEDR